MKWRIMSMLGTVILVGSTLVSLPVSAAPEPEGPSPSKIGIVDRRKVLEGYGKAKTQWDAFAKESATTQAEIDKRLDGIRKRKADYEKGRAQMPEDQRLRTENQLNRDVSQLEVDAQSKQKEIDDKRAQFMKKATAEIDAAIDAIGKERHYYVILKADEAHSLVAYFAPAADLTLAVLERLNGSAPAPVEKGEKKTKRP